MRRHSAVLRRLVKASVLVLGAGIVLAGCAPVKFGSAAIVGNQSITIATLDTDASSLSLNAKPFANLFKLSQAEATQDTLTWLIRFQINEQLARAEGITVSTAQAQAALAAIYAEAKSELESEGVSDVTLNYILSYIGIPPNLAPEVGRYQAIETQYVEQVNGGKVPTSTAAQTATTAKLQQAQCVAAKTLQIQVNPQFGRLNYTQFAVVTVPSTVAAPPGPAKATSTSGLTPAC